uniref:Type II/IV secretion system ATP hydrolase TadA/VirB11/CpaF, TadA subfamily n=2 Tax=Vibrionaceae TaxID=641 RepID=A0A0H3ZQB2_VIBSP|nr:Type II/IV secretion system ATP hydrolase TadA/VirB11/CpaF, TadA subfamily [Vibrio splendidus]AKN40554.1 ATPase required for both assembly of type IV secretion complex and secretion of T-DNA complex, VirB11 [Enterovibrio norvegicus]
MNIDLPLNSYLKPLKKYLDRKDCVEICINHEHEVVIENTKGEWSFIKDNNVTRKLFEDLANYLANKSGQRFDSKMPIFSGRLPNYGYRMQIMTGAMVESGLAVCIRVSQAQKLPLNSWMSEEKAKELSDLIVAGNTILICAGTGCGKTTLMNSMIEYIPLDKRIVTLQDTQELVVNHRNVVHFIKSKTDTDIAGLEYKHFMNCITRTRPDRILLGEIDVDNTVAFLNLSSSGHAGSISTIHAENPIEAVNRLCINAQMSGKTTASVESIRKFALDSVHYFIMLTKTTTKAGRVFKADFISTKELINEF